MEQRPTLTTERLVLRPFTLDDAPEVQRYVADREIARTTAAIPHPYPDNGAVEWIATHQHRFEEGSFINFAITRADDRQLVGAIDIRPNGEHDRAEIGYVIYRPFWGNGYASEAASAVVRYGFEQLGLNRIEAHHFANNPASGRVLQKAGMIYEGTMRQHVRKWGEFIDTVHYAILRSEYDGTYPGARDDDHDG